MEAKVVQQQQQRQQQGQVSMEHEIQNRPSAKPKLYG